MRITGFCVNYKYGNFVGITGKGILRLGWFKVRIFCGDYR